MATLERGFEDNLQDALLDAAEHELVGKRDNLVFQAIQQSHEALRDYADQYPGIESIIESLGEVDVDRTESGITVHYGWEHPAAPYFAFGTSEHTIDGDPVLSFVWEDPPEWVQEEFEQEGDGYRVFFDSVDVSGIDETRFVRVGLRWLELHVTGTVYR